MKRTFVIDEGILICAQTGQDENGNSDLSAARLLLDFIGNCHRIALNADITEKYKRQFSSLTQRRFVGAVNVVDILRNAMFNSDKVTEIAHPTPLDPRMLAAIPHDDLPFVSAAITAQAVLVTVDTRLRDCLNDCGVIQRYGLTVLRPEDAVHLAAPTR